MKKILTLFTVLCMTLIFTGCTKTVKLEDIDSANFTEDILSIKCTNTLEEMMSEDYEPKFEVSNNYKEGDIPYLNFDFDKKDEINDMFKAYALGYHSSTLANNINISKEYEDGYYNSIQIGTEITCYAERYLFITTHLSRYLYMPTTIMCIDLENKKLLTGEEILAIKDYNIDESLDKIYNCILSLTGYSDISNKELLFKTLKEDLADTNIYIGDNKYEKETFNLKEYGIIFHSEDYYDFLESSSSMLGNKSFYLNINENGELELLFNHHGGGRYTAAIIKLEDF